MNADDKKELLRAASANFLDAQKLARMSVPELMSKSGFVRGVVVAQADMLCMLTQRVLELFDDLENLKGKGENHG